ncbi:putative UGA2-succinate semialdehyde dehydrogenase [Fusarium proliferatum ET1]|uniref:Succinate-semialdehyde dehydrogenase n=1 Tax=Fusarium proliferatum (strain ET1) TaxID=1227346 RepID=A0A1L7VQF6_FUSPR|nr:putative UGA2-succinate semialdehyde dehydrogenase [Fusarium proliferatum ET1]CZR42697.1 probable UGA2-succinate semialdehyde dehydrogenase [Fusarium proliferatum ET1]
MANAVPQLRDPSLLIQKNFINNEWVDSVSGKTFKVYDPATGSTIGSCPESTPEDAERAIRAASAALPVWRSATGRNRSRILRHWYELVLENKDDLATLITLENGKSKADAAGEVLFAASFIEWFAEEAPRIYGDVISHSQSSFRVSTLKEPIGVCGLITPWNFPAAMIARKLAPALAAGCTSILKPAFETPFTANALLSLLSRTSLPAGVVNSITADTNTPSIGQTLCSSNIVRKISFTGSTRVGKLLMSQSSGTLKRMSLELGGNAPFIVFDDADLDVAVKAAVTSKFKSSGQTCVCSNRIFVQKGVYDEFLRRLREEVGKFKVGSGFDAKTTHGPLISAAAVRRLEGLVNEAVQGGAKVECGGSALKDQGPNFFDPTILSNVETSMRVVDEEIFGPVAPVFSFDEEEAIIQVANKCDVGLASYIFTQDLNRATRVTEQLQFGMVAVNSGVVSDAAAPFGGVKHSGLGREGSKYGIEDYLQIKTVVLGNVNVQHRALL